MVNCTKPIPAEDMTAEQWLAMEVELRRIIRLARQIAFLEDALESFQAKPQFIGNVSCFDDLDMYRRQSFVYKAKSRRLQDIIDAKRYRVIEMCKTAVAYMPNRPPVLLDGFLFTLSFWPGDYPRYTLSITSKTEAVRIHG